jgi:hypothetical protein
MSFFSPLGVVGLLALACSAASQASAPNVVRTPVMLGDTSITIVQEQYARWAGWTASDCAVPINMLNLHRNEETSIRAARQFFTQEPCGGRITFVDHGSASAPVRNVVFSLGGKSYNFDPNRVFTKRGREISLGATGAPEAAVGAYVSTLLSIYGWNATEHVITLHNTGGSYGANSYLPGQSYAAEASRVTVQGGTSTLLFLTRGTTFDCMIASKAIVSLVLQTPDIVNNVVDANEGSLSLFAEVAKKDYINSETYHGVLRDQMLVLKTAVDVCLLKRSTLAVDEIQQKAGTTYCTETSLGRTGVCIASGTTCVGSVKTGASGCGSNQQCCVAGGCTLLTANPPQAGKCISDAQCPSGSGFPSNGGATATGCQSDPAAIKCCTSFAFPPLPAVVKSTSTTRQTTTTTKTTTVTTRTSTTTPTTTSAPTPTTTTSSSSQSLSSSSSSSIPSSSPSSSSSSSFMSSLDLTTTADVGSDTTSAQTGSSTQTTSSLANGETTTATARTLSIATGETTGETASTASMLTLSGLVALAAVALTC